MPANALVQTRIDATVKDRAAAVLDAMGLTVSDAVRVLLTRIANEGTFPLGFTTGPPPMTPGSAPRSARRSTTPAPPSPRKPSPPTSPPAERLHPARSPKPARETRMGAPRARRP